MAATHAAEARRIVAGQRLLIETLKASGRPTKEAEVALRSYISALRVLEQHERKLREERRARHPPQKKQRRPED